MFKLKVILFILYLIFYNCFLLSNTHQEKHLSFRKPNEIHFRNPTSYQLKTLKSSCSANNFCMPLMVVDSIGYIIGYDITMAYDKNKVNPTGSIYIDDDLVNPSFVDYIYAIDQVNGLINISVYFNVNAPSNAMFFGIGQVLCVEFTKLIYFSPGDSTVVSVLTLQESYANSTVNRTVSNGSCISFQDSIFTGHLKFWANAMPISYDTANPNANLITKISGVSTACTNSSNVFTQPNVNGSFFYNINHGSAITISKDIFASTNVQPVINGGDAFLARRVLLNDLTFTPSVYQMIAMDVNLDGVISSGDITQINLRSIGKQTEFKQAWNYNFQGISNGQLSKDWLFIDLETLNMNAAYKISTNFPANDNLGYSKLKVPQVSFCAALPLINVGACNLIFPETYIGVLLGDVNGNFATVNPKHLFKSSVTKKVIFDISKAIVNDSIVEIPVSVSSETPVHALDLAIPLLEKNLIFKTIVNHSQNLESESYFNPLDRTLRITSNSMQNYELKKSIISVRFNLNGARFHPFDLGSIDAYVNGEQASLKVIDADNEVNSVHSIEIFPNPSKDLVSVSVSEDAAAQVLDLNGKLVVYEPKVKANVISEINVSALPNGVYVIKIANDNFVSAKKLVIKK
jgi:Secretion system C-terminal sorting domain